MEWRAKKEPVNVTQDTAETQVVDHDDVDKSIGRGYAIAG